MTYTHLTNSELMARVIMNGEGDALSRELALRLEAKTEELEDLRIEIASESETCRECGARQ